DIVAELLGAWPGRDLPVTGTANEDAAAGAEVVVLATPWDSIVPTARQLADPLAGKVVVSVANALVKQGREMHALVPARGSLAAAVQAVLPESAVAAACQHLPAAELADLRFALNADVLVCADVPEATATTMALVNDIEGLRALDVGSLASAGPIEAFTAVLVNLNIRYKVHSTLRLDGID
ncbi:MAG: NAD(P)-binding domain-containing protein, partial [Acidimicrobiales bacterium]